MILQSRQIFLEFASGKFGQFLVQCFMDILTHTYKDHLRKGLGPSQSRAKEVFSNVLFGMGDCWRRLVHEVDCYPWKLFEICPMTESQFAVRFSELEEQLRKCPSCLDVELTLGLLKSAKRPGESMSSLYVQWVLLLLDMATFTPLSTDSVEVLHGQLQNVIKKFRGRGKLARACCERSVFHSLVSEHMRTLEKLKLETLPNARLVGVIERPAPAYQSREHPLEKQSNRKLRKLCGWNVFLREGLRGVELSKDEYSRREQQLSRTWQSMCIEERTPYKVRAAWEMERRHFWRTTALPVGYEQDEAAVEIGQRMVHKLNFDRLAINYQNLREHPGWKAGLGLGDCDGALKAESLEMAMTDAEVAAALDPVLKQVCGAEQEPDMSARRMPACLGTCHSQHGLCIASPFFAEVQKLVKGFARCVRDFSLRSGALLQFWVGGSTPPAGPCATVFLATTVLRPSQHIFVCASLQGSGRVRLKFPEAPERTAWAIPEFTTSHKLFESLLFDTGRSRHPQVYARELDFSLDEFTPDSDIETHTFLEVTVGAEQRAPFVLCKQAGAEKKPKPKLPFGLGKVVRKRKQHVKRSQNPQAAKKSKATSYLRKAQSKPASSQDLIYEILAWGQKLKIINYK